MSQWETVRYESLANGRVARITLARPEVRNAQNRRMLAELDEAFATAAFDDDVKVIILAADGPHFSSGHDLKDLEQWPHDPNDVTGGLDRKPTGLAGGFAKPGAEGYFAFEEEVFFRMCRRWHDLPKPTIAQVHGKTVAAGLMLMWVCDLIVASDDATFADPTVQFGVNGVEWFSHPWELGIRKAKELLFTGDAITATEARQLGLINRTANADELSTVTLELAEKISAKPSFALKLAKMAVNQTLDAQGFWTAQQAAFSLQHLGHAAMRERAADEERGDAIP